MDNTRNDQPPTLANTPQSVDEKVSLTPVRKPGQSITMSFPDAIKEVINGKSITRIAWGNKDFCLVKDGWLVIFTKGKFHTWSVNDGDLEANDWIVKEEMQRSKLND
jgi:hypothetical protein|tara:strand:+ start:11818 stop:12138 length:321 start_codon:yes stop_codon:yes gene_type:complete